MAKKNNKVAKYATAGFRKRKGITRTTKDDGWKVVVRWKNTIDTRTFPDTLGGMRKALEWAIFWRDMVENRIGKPRSEKRVKTKFKPRWYKFAELREIAKQ